MNGKEWVYAAIRWRKSSMLSQNSRFIPGVSCTQGQNVSAENIMKDIHQIKTPAQKDGSFC